MKAIQRMIFLTLTSTLLIACNTTEKLSDDTIQTTSARIEVIPDAEFEKRLIYPEDIPQDNCTGNSTMINTIERSESVKIEVTVGGGVAVDANGEIGIPGVGKIGIGSAISGNAGLTYGHEQTLTRSATLMAESGSNLQHTVRHLEVWETGTVNVIAAGQSYSYPYALRRDFALEMVDPANLGCPPSASISSNPPNAPEFTTETQPTNIIESTIETKSTIDIDTILPNIISGNGGIEVAAPWWKAISSSGENGIYDPTVPPGGIGCYGVAWNVLGLERTVVVIQTAQALDFQPGGWYVLICFTDKVELSAMDVGRIQSDWLGKEHGGTWLIEILD